MDALRPTAHRAWAKPGVWLFSLDAASPLAVAGARRFFHLPRCQVSAGTGAVQGAERLPGALADGAL